MPIIETKNYSKLAVIKRLLALYNRANYANAVVSYDQAWLVQQQIFVLSRDNKFIKVSLLMPLDPEDSTHAKLRLQRHSEKWVKVTSLASDDLKNELNTLNYHLDSTAYILIKSELGGLPSSTPIAPIDIKEYIDYLLKKGYLTVNDRSDYSNMLGQVVGKTTYYLSQDKNFAARLVKDYNFIYVDYIAQPHENLDAQLNFFSALLKEAYAIEQNAQIWISSNLYDWQDLLQQKLCFTLIEREQYYHTK